MSENISPHDQAWKRRAILFLASQNISLFGSSVTGFAIIWHVTLQTSSGVWMTLIVLASMVPQVLISLWAGVWADRYNRKYLIMASDGGIAAATLGLAVLYMAGYNSLELLLAVAAARSLGSGVQSPAVNAVIPQLVPTASLTRFNGINQSLNATMQLLAPAVGGVVLGTIGIAWAFMLDVITAGLAIILLRYIPISRTILPGAAVSVGKQMRQGLLFCWSNPLLRSLIICYALAFFLMSPAAFLTPVMIERSFGNDVWLLTANELVWTTGSLIGGGYIAWRGKFRDKVKVIAYSLIGFGVTFGLLGLSDAFWAYLCFMGMAGLILPFFTTAETVLIQETVAPEMMGRVFSILQLTALTAMPTAMLVFGPLADFQRIERILIVTGVLLAGVGAGFLGFARKAMIGQGLGAAAKDIP